MKNEGIFTRLKALLPGKRMRLSEYLEEYRRRNREERRGNSFNSMASNMEHHLRQCLGSGFATLAVNNIDTDLCKRFANYLKRANKSTGEPLSQVSAHHYFSAFRTMLDEAVADGLLGDNPALKLRKQEIPRRPMVTKTYLDAEEVARLSLTPCTSDVVKRAFMFSCLTGLRLSDIRRLRWRDIHKEGDGWRFSIIMQKTQEPLQSKLSSEACRWLGPSDDEHLVGRHPAGNTAEETIFPLPSNSTLCRILRQWTTEAGIMKHVTFHTARHSYATMALSAGTDIYTISKLLGHRNINTTAVYAAVVDTQRDAAVDSVSRLLQQRLEKYKLVRET